MVMLELSVGTCVRDDWSQPRHAARETDCNRVPYGTTVDRRRTEVVSSRQIHHQSSTTGAMRS